MTDSIFKRFLQAQEIKISSSATMPQSIFANTDKDATINSKQSCLKCSKIFKQCRDNEVVYRRRLCQIQREVMENYSG